MASNVVANAQTNDTQKKSPVKRVSLKQRKDQILKKKEELNAKKADLDFTDAEVFTVFWRTFLSWFCRYS